MASDEEVIAAIKRIAGWAVFGIIMLIIVFGSWYTVPAGYEGVVLTFGKASMVAAQPGFHFKLPLVQKVVLLSVQTQKFGADASQSTLESAASKDLQVVKVRLAVNYHVAQGKTPELYNNVGLGFEDNVISPSVHEATKAEVAQYVAADLINKREEVRAGIENLLKEKLKQYNIVIEQVSITDFDFSDQFNVAIENKVTAEQQRLKAENDLLRIKVEADQLRAQADGERDAAIARANGTATANLLQLKAQAEGDALKIELANKQLQSSPQYIEYFKLSRWNGAYPTFYMSGGSSPNLLLQVPTP
jgi:regulator of protease activity HflC (stomatin/prohibitin superfamily)